MQLILKYRTPIRHWTVFGTIVIKSSIKETSSVQDVNAGVKQ